MMRSELPWLETRSPWQRFGPTLLGLSIIGLGMGGAIRIVRAQVTVAPSALPVAQVTVTPGPLPVAQASPAVPAPPAPEDRAASRELDDLLQQRADLDIRIADLRRRLRSGTRSSPRPTDPQVTPRVQLDPRSPEWQRAVEAAQEQAQRALEQAREAMQQAQEALREAQRAGGAHINSGRGLYNFDLKGMPQPPAFNFNGKSIPQPPAFSFQWQGDALSKQDAERMKQWQQQWEQQWKQMQPQFEQQMREFQKRMEEWQRSFEDQMQKQQQLRSRSLRRTQPDDSKDTTKPSADVREKESKESDERDSEETKAADKAETRAADKAADTDSDSEPL